MSLVAKLNHGGLQTLGDIYATETGKGVYANLLQVSTISTLIGDVNMTGGNLTVTLGNGWFKKDLTVGEPLIGLSTLTVYGLITVPPGAGYTTGLLIERNVSITGTLDLVGAVDINGDLTLDVGHTLYVDNILRSDTGLGSLNIEGIRVEGNFLYTDNIAEKTGANGIRIDLLRLLDHTINHVTPGTEIILEEDTRIRDPHKLEVSHIYEADLSSDITLHSTTIVSGLSGTGYRAVRASSTGALSRGPEDYYYLHSYAANDTVTVAPTRITSSMYLKTTGGGATATGVLNVDMDSTEFAGMDVVVHIFVHQFTNAGSGTDTVNIRDNVDTVIWTNSITTTDEEMWAVVLFWSTAEGWRIMSSAEVSSLNP